MVSSASIRRGLLAAIIAILALASVSVTGMEGKIAPQAPGSKQETRSTIIVPPAPEKLVTTPQPSCVSAVLMDAGNGQVLHAKNAHARLPIASTTNPANPAIIIFFMFQRYFIQGISLTGVKG